MNCRPVLVFMPLPTVPTAWLIALCLAVPALKASPNPPAVPLAADSGRILLGTRGFARVSADVRNANQEAQTLFRVELPYGAAPGWKLTYQGYSDGTRDDVHLLAVGLWLQQAVGKPLARRRVTFDGLKGIVIPPGALRESDGIPEVLPPGARVWVTTWYRAGTTATGLPYQTFLYTRELAGVGTESQDGTLAGARGSLADHTLSGGFEHRALDGPLTAGLAYLCRGYQPLCVTGRPHPSYAGPKVAPLFIGDSINVMNDDFNDDGREWTFRGFSGRFCKDRYPFLVFGQSGSGSGGFLALTGTPLFRYVFGAPGGTGRICTHCVNEYGINEIRNSGDATATWKNRAAVAAVCRAQGVPYTHCTLTPCGAGNLTGAARQAGYAAFVAQRKAFNDRVRAESDETHLPGCVGFIDPCRLLEADPTRSNNVWAADVGGDLHPNSTGHQHYAETISPSLFLREPPGAKRQGTK
jgi:hypothetical protein